MSLDVSGKLGEAQYAASLADRLHEIRASSEAYFQNRDNRGALSTLHRQVHSLAGSAGTFGYTELGHAARALEHMTHLTPDADPRSINQTQLRAALARLFSCALDIAETA